MSINENLEQIGLSKNETKAYLALLKMGPSSILSISRETGLNRPLLYRHLDPMVGKGIIKVTLQKSRKHYSAVPPKQLINYIKTKEDSLRLAMPELEALALVADKKPRVLYFEGKPQLQELLRSQNKAKNKEILAYFPSKFMISLLGKRELEKVIQDRINNGIKVKILRSADSEKEYEGWELREKALREVRHIPDGQHLEMGLVIFDDKVNLFSSVTENFGVQIESRAYATLMRYFFDSLWDRSEQD